MKLAAPRTEDNYASFHISLFLSPPPPPLLFCFNFNFYFFKVFEVLFLKSLVPVLFLGNCDSASELLCSQLL